MRNFLARRACLCFDRSVGKPIKRGKQPAASEVRRDITVKDVNLSIWRRFRSIQVELGMRPAELLEIAMLAEIKRRAV